MRRLSSFCFALVVILAAGNALAQTTYRWVDPKTGKTVITDTPPPASAKVLDRQKASGDDPDASLPYAVRKAKENFPVTLYTSADYPAESKRARDLLNQRGIPFAEKAMQQEGAQEELKALTGSILVPSIKVGSQSIRGYSEETWNNMLDLAGYPRTAPYGSKPQSEPAK